MFHLGKRLHRMFSANRRRSNNVVSGNTVVTANPTNRGGSASASPSSRVQTFDLMRGWFLVAIILDHLNYFPNGLDWWSARGNLYVTTAEGFFLISGIVLGIVRGPKLLDAPMSTVSKLLLRRGLQLYATLVVTVILFTLLGWFFFLGNPTLKWGIMEPWNWGRLLYDTLTLQYYYGWTDYLRLYALFLFASPLAFWLLRRKQWYIIPLLSLAIWALFPRGASVPDDTQMLYQPLTWQLIFFSGIIIGFHWKSITTWWHGLSRSTIRICTSLLLSLAGITLLVNILLAFNNDYFHIVTPDYANSVGHRLYIHYFDKEALPIGRLALFATWFWAAFYIFNRYDSLFRKLLGSILLPFGTHSLYVYTVQGFLIYFVHLYTTKSTNIFINALIAIGIIAVMRVMIHYKILMKIIPR